MSHVMTVLGPIPPEKLGFTSMHDHILSDARFYRQRWDKLGVIPNNFKIPRQNIVSLENIGLLKQNYYMLDDNLIVDDEELITLEVQDYVNSGGKSLVDVSVPGMRCNVLGIKRIAERTGLQIITSTGLYIEESWPANFHKMSIKELADYFAKEIIEGIGDTGIKAGHIKTAINELSEPQENLLKAAVRASLDTGTSVSIHPGLGIGSDGRRIASIMINEGMKPEKIIINHTDGSFGKHSIRELILHPENWGLTLEHALEMLDLGINISIDCFGHFSENDWADVAVETEWQRLAGLVSLLKKGYSSQIVLGTDCAFKYHFRRYGGFGYCRLTEYIIPLLRSIDVSDYDIRQMIQKNPERLLAF